ncbi:hypothetical protein LTR66_009124 [Elasticomyces elasticus]|nr:hypothetical protein LTR66_009124 [Elasticomyces elasticus]KAK5011154.1 hypothetical protein LTR28_005267 [Elasticomyces elasticus]
MATCCKTQIVFSYCFKKIENMPQYSADWGDYIAFAKHFRDRADADGSDLLLIDSGDRVEGNGLYDASNPKGKYTFDIIKEQHIDIIVSGNHELYLRNSSDNEYFRTVPDYKGHYLASNLDIYNPESGKLEPLAPRFKKFTTKNQGIRIVAFGFLYDFHGNANNTVVTPVEDSLKEGWFQDAIHDRDVDLFLIAGHIPVRNCKETTNIYKAIRDVHWDTPIQFFGGHFHIRDYAKYDRKAYGLASGRYMETIGFQSISGLTTSREAINVTLERAGPTFARRYIDNNLFSMHRHTGTNSFTFRTEHGKNVSSMITHARKELHLDKTYGCAPQDLWLNRAPYPANDSILTWLENEVLPDSFDVKVAGSAAPRVIITNSGAMRFDIFSGPFTIDTTFLISPFTSGFRYIPAVPYSSARQVLALLNNQGPISLQDLVAFSKAHPDVETTEDKMTQLDPHHPQINVPTRWETSIPSTKRFGPSLQRPVDVRYLRTFDSDGQLLPGYTTVDDGGNDGDDTLHAPIRFYDVPNCIAANIGFSTGATPDTVALVYNQFIERWVLLALRYLGEKYEQSDTREILEGKSLTEIISDWVASHWQC